MKIIEVIKNEPCVCITPYSYKKKILEDLSNSFYQVSFYTLEELKKLICYEYHPQALWKYSKEFNLTIENAKIELDALYAINDEADFSDLYYRKQWLEGNNLLIKHPGFINSLNAKKIVVCGYEPYELKFLSKKINLNYIIDDNEGFAPKVYEYETLEQEVVGTAEKIIKLLNDGVSINQIKIGKLSSDYDSIIKKVFNDFKIPLARQLNHSLFEYSLIQDFLKLIEWDKSLKEIHIILENLEKKYPKENNFFGQLYEKLIEIINTYYDENLDFNDIKDILIYELKNRTVKKDKYTNVVQEVSFLDTLFKEEDYVFLMGVNLGEIPPVYEDQDFFSDIEKERLNLSTSLEMTKGIEKKFDTKIKSLKHVFISYKKKSPFKEYLPSTIIENWKEIGFVTIEKGKYEYSNHNYNTYLLNASLDDYMNYNEIKSELSMLYGLEPLYYRNYNNQFKEINPNILKEKLPFCLLSYTGMQKFFECPFKYYMNAILKIDVPFKETPSLIVGNLFHSILEKYFKENNDLEKIVDEELEKIEITPKEKRNFYVKKYREEILRLIRLMEEQQSRSSFEAKYFEETIFWDEKQEITFRIFGKIDKILTFQDDKNAYIVVIDYKTGKASSDLSKIIYGMNMQLFMYLYLISNDERFKEYNLGGAYIESISSTIPNYTEGKTLEDLLWEQSKLDGFSLKRNSFIEKLDSKYFDSSYIKGVRVKKDGDFYANNKLLEENTIDQLLEIIKNNIEVVKEAIINADFKIAPKKFSSEIGDKVSSCAYCNYRDICYLKAKNVVTLKEYKNLEFLEGGDSDDTSEAS